MAYEGPENVRDILAAVSEGRMTVDRALENLDEQRFQDLGFAKIDHSRAQRTGFPEVIFCEGKQPHQVADIAEQLWHRNGLVLGTRAGEDTYKAVKERLPQARYQPEARTITIGTPERMFGRYVAVLSAGTSDIPVAEEAAITAEMMGADVKRVYDVGVAGIHRLFAHRQLVTEAAALVVVAGMEGALASVVAGLVRNPVIAVPTSVGYGASFRGLAALLGMLNACAAGIAVVNIDNGFGGGYMAALIAGLAKDTEDS